MTDLARAPGTPLSLPLRVWLFVEIGFGLAALSSIALSPQDSATNFAWPIKPTVTAALLGAFYAASAGIFVLAAFARRWEDIRLMVLPATLFTAAELVATFLHWEKFTVGSTPFNVWFASYLLPPPIFLACYVWQQRKALPEAGPERLPTALRLPMLLVGAAITLLALASFIVPQILIGVAPWPFTPLTTRAVCGWLLALGTMLAGLALADDRQAGRILSPFFVLLGPAIALQIARFPEGVDFGHPAIYVGGAVLVFVLLAGLNLASAGWNGFFFAKARLDSTS